VTYSTTARVKGVCAYGNDPVCKWYIGGYDEVTLGCEFHDTVVGLIRTLRGHDDRDKIGFGQPDESVGDKYDGDGETL
jgi:hypothetical protein